MNWQSVEGAWKLLRGRVREQWGRLTDDDVNVIEGRRERLVGKVQERYGVARDQAEREIRIWLDMLEFRIRRAKTIVS